MNMVISQHGRIVGEIHSWFDWLRFVYRYRRVA